MTTYRRMLSVGLVIAAVSIETMAPISRAFADIKNYAIVREDGSLQISGWRIHLYGIHIPDTGRSCTTSGRRVPRCGSQAFLALNDRIRGFVRCVPQIRNTDGSLDAICYVAGLGSVLEPEEDLAAYLLRRGLAVALPDAPFEYVTLERIARAQRQGIWRDGID